MSTGCDEFTNESQSTDVNQSTNTNESANASNSYSVNVGSYRDFQDLEIYHFENFDKDVAQQTATTFYKGITSNEEFMLFIESLKEDTNISEQDMDRITEQLPPLEVNFFDKNALIVTFLYESTTPYYYACENITIVDDSTIVTLKVSGDGIGDAEQNTLLFIATEQFSDNLAITISKTYE